MNTHKYTELELELTAILYATRENVVDHVVKHRALPAHIPLGGFPTAMNVLLKHRGLCSPLSEKEKLVFEAICSEKRLPGGGVILVDERIPIYSVESNQVIEISPGPRTMDWVD